MAAKAKKAKAKKTKAKAKAEKAEAEAKRTEAEAGGTRSGPGGAGADGKPSLASLVAMAGRCYASLTARMREFSRIYVTAGDLYGQEGRKAIRDRFPLYTACSWELVEAIGRGELLPQLFLCSRRFANGVMRLEDSLDRQVALLGMTRDGDGVPKVEVADATGRTALRSFDELSRRDEDAILYALKRGGSPAEAGRLVREYRRMFPRAGETPAWMRDGDRVKVNRRFVMDAAAWRAIGRTMGWLDGGADAEAEAEAEAETETEGGR